MAAILDPVRPETDEPRADALQQLTEPGDAETAVVEDAIPLESMTWPELKREARKYDLKLNVKKPVLIRQIRDARAAIVEDQTHRQTFRGRVETLADAARKRLESGKSWFVDWWKSDQNDTAEPAPDAPNRAGMSQFAKVAICVGGILAGGVAAVLAALI